MIEQHARSRCTNQSEANDELVGRRERERGDPGAHSFGFNDYYRADDCTIKQHIAVPGTPWR